MKKLLFLILAVVLAFSVQANETFYVDGLRYCFVENHIYDEHSHDWYWVVDSTKVVVTGYDEDLGDVPYHGDIVIPSQVRYQGKTYPVVQIGFQAFSFCTELTSIDIPSSVTIIKEAAFAGCTGLTNVYTGDGVTTIEKYAFCGCDLDEVTIGKSVTEIAGLAFGRDLEEFSGNCSKNPITKVTCLAAIPPTIKTIYQETAIKNVFVSTWISYVDWTNQFSYEVYDNATLYVPMASKDAYSHADDWKLFAHIVGTDYASYTSDLNGDGSIDVADVVAMIDFVLGKNPQPFDLEVADVNGDGIIDVNDVVALINYLLSGSW